MDTEGVYVFTPVIEGYTVSAELPEITVTVGDMLPVAPTRRMKLLSASPGTTIQIVLPKGKKLKEHTTVIRYEASNKAIATVNSKGKITAKGTCYVYAYAQNGVYMKIKVVVE